MVNKKPGALFCAKKIHRQTDKMLLTRKPASNHNFRVTPIRLPPIEAQYLFQRK